ncbi:MAG: glycosyltransferase family 2 protein, partial [Mucilaginibacter sp.]
MLFTIAIPAYKSQFLEECIASILGQTCTDFELIIVNDCSPQPVEEIVNKFIDPRIHYSKNEVNIGAENLVL